MTEAEALERARKFITHQDSEPRDVWVYTRPLATELLAVQRETARECALTNESNGYLTAGGQIRRKYNLNAVPAERTFVSINSTGKGPSEQVGS